MKATTRRALLANDDLFFSTRLLSVLRGMGIQTSSATTAAQALDLANRAPFDLALVNLGSAHLQGLHLVRALKQADSSPRILAFVPHVRLHEMRAAALEAGVDKLCVNSAVHKRLPEIVERLLAGDGRCEEEDHAYKE